MRQTVKSATPATLQVVTYVDGHGKEETRLAVRSGGRHYLFAERAGDVLLLREAAEWLQTALGAGTGARPGEDVSWTPGD